MFRNFFWMVAMIIFIQACQSSESGTGAGNFVPDPAAPSLAGNAREVIYALSLPTDIAGLFEETGTGFNPGLLLPLEWIPMYDDPGKMAMLMGTLGVDLSYCKLFEQFLESAECLKQVEILADKLNLPQEIFESPSAGFENFIHEPDSLAHLIHQLYSDVDQYFKENDQASLASLSLLGGWLEAMYIGVKIYQDKSVPEMGDRILQQKYALNNLLGLLSSQQESLMIRSYIHPLNKLKSIYDEVEIMYRQDGFTMDQNQRTIMASDAEIHYADESLESICRIIIRLREEMIQFSVQ